MATLFALALVFALAVVFYVFLDRIDKERQSWASERRELLNRIQHPEVMPDARSEPYVLPEREPEPDGWNEVGTITIDPEYVSE